jgi:hypothetical protein
VDPRVSEVAKGALRKLSEPAGAEALPALPAELRIGSVNLVQLSRLAYLQAGDPLVDQVLAMLRAGRPVFLDRPASEASIRLSDYPPRVQEQFQRWFVRISHYGIALTGAPVSARGSLLKAPLVQSPAPSPIPRPEPKGVSVLTPERQILSEILGNPAPESHPCWLERKKACCGSGRCKTLGF